MPGKPVVWCRRAIEPKVDRSGRTPERIRAWFAYPSKAKEGCRVYVFCVLHSSSCPFLLQAEAYRLARDMLELALTTVKIAEENEYEHAVEAGQKLEKAVHQEYVLNKAAQTAHKEAQEAFDQDKSFDRHDLANSDEWEKYRQLVSFEMARRVEEYVQDRLNDARAAEGAAKLEEQVADLHLLELMEKADELRVFLNQLEQQPKKAQKSQEIRHPVLDCE